MEKSHDTGSYEEDEEKNNFKLHEDGIRRITLRTILSQLTSQFLISSLTREQKAT